MACSTFESSLLDVLTAAIMLPLQAVGAAAWLLWTALVGLWGLVVAIWRPLALVATVAGCGAVCWLCPLLPLGLGIIVVVGWLSYPRSAVCS